MLGGRLEMCRVRQEFSGTLGRKYTARTLVAVNQLLVSYSLKSSLKETTKRRRGQWLKHTTHVPVPQVREVSKEPLVLKHTARREEKAVLRICEALHELEVCLKAGWTGGGAGGSCAAGTVFRHLPNHRQLTTTRSLFLRCRHYFHHFLTLLGRIKK